MSEIKYKKLDDLLKFLPKSKIKAGDGQEAGKYRFFKSGADQSKFIDVAKFEGESLIIGDGGNANIQYYNDKFSTSDHCYVIQKQEDLDIDIKYVYYFLKTNIQILEAGFKGAGLKNISKKYISNIKIPIQPLKNQRKISTFLTQIEKLIEKREGSIKLLDELLKSTFLDMFQNILTKKNLPSYYSFNTFCTIDTNMVDDFIKYSEFPHIGISSIEKNTGKILNYKLVKDENLVSGKYLFDERHILYSKIRPNLNKVALPDFKGLLSADAYPILPNNDLVTKEFLAYLLRSKYFLNYILSHSDRANIPKVNKQALFGFKCNIPDIFLQKRFSNIVKQVEISKFVYQESLKELKQLFNSTAQKAFKGELDLSKIEIEQTQEKEALKMLDKEQLLELIKQGNFDPKEYVNSEQSYDNIRDMIFELLDEKKINHSLIEYTKEDGKKSQKIVLEKSI